MAACGTVAGLGTSFKKIPGMGFDIKNSKNTPVLGGGIRGFIPQPIINHENDNEFSQTRFTLREAWNTDYVRQAGSNKRIITPFRAVNNSGDILSRKNYSCGGSCQSFQSRPGLHGLKTLFGAINSKCDNSNVPPASCNVKYVYDSSDYITYVKQRAQNKNYNDRSFGGDNYSAGQSAMRAIRRY
jgi:hypothetical protein